MGKIYNGQDLVKILTKELTTAIAQKKAWEEVIYPTKKDGKPFKNLQKNIEGANLTVPYSGAFEAEKLLRVYCFSNESGYTHDEIYCYDTVSNYYNFKNCKRALDKPQNITSNGYVKIYSYDLEDIKEAVTNRITELDLHIKSLTEQIEKAEKIYNTFKAKYEALEKELLEACGTDPLYSTGNSTYYKLKETFTN